MANKQDKEPHSPLDDEDDEREGGPRLLPLTNTQGKREDADEQNLPVEDDTDEADQHAAEEDWNRTLARLKAELVPATHVVAIDGSPDSDRAFSWAVRSLPRHDRLLLVYGTRRVPLPGLEVTLLERRSADEQRRKQRRKVRALAKHYARRCEDAGRECYFERVQYWGPGDLANQICRAADVNDAHTVISGSRGLGTMQRLMVGSVSTALLHQCHTTVVIARDEPQATHAFPDLTHRI